MHLGIFAATVGGGYLIWQKTEQWRLAERRPAEKQVKKVTPKRSQRPPSLHTPTEPPKLASQAKPHDAVPPVPKPPAAAINPFSGFPQHLSLPPADDTSVVTLLADVKDCELSFISSHEAMAHEGNKLIWQEDENPVVAAGLTIRKNALLFRWIADVPDDAQKAVVNSLIELHRQGQTYTAPLRTPEIVETFTFDLTDAVHYVKCDCPFPPDPKQVCVSIGMDPTYPDHRLEGCELKCLKWQDSTMLFYAQANDAATKISLGRKGNLAVLTIDSRYALPSGDDEPMSIGKGNRKRKELEDLIGQAQRASAALPRLRSTARSLQSDLQRAQNISVWNTVKGVRIYNSITAGKKFLLMKGLTSQKAAVQNRIALARQLISDRPATQRDLSELERVALLAQQLHLKAQLRYRFYHLVGDREVDLVIAE